MKLIALQACGKPEEKLLPTMARSSFVFTAVDPKANYWYMEALLKLLPSLMHVGACLTQINSLQLAIILLKEIEVTLVLIN